MRFLFSLAASVFGFVISANDISAQKNPPIRQIKGKTVEQWIKEIPSKDPSKGEEAIRTILLFHPDVAYQVVPVLIKELKRHNNGSTVDISIRVNAVIALGVILGEGGANDPEPKVVDEAVTLLMRYLTDGQLIVKNRAAQALGRIGPPAKPAIPKLIAASKDRSSWKTREAGVTALGYVAREQPWGPSEEVVEALIRALADSASPVRLAAIKALLWVGGPADAKKRAMLVQGLRTYTLNDSDRMVRFWACMTIMLLEGKAFPLPKLLP
jgi:hypothetical protein